MDVNKLVVSYFTTNRSALVELFQRVGPRALLRTVPFPSQC